MTYDSEGNEASRTDRLGLITTYVYDAANRLTQTTNSENNSTSREKK